MKSYLLPSYFAITLGLSGCASLHAPSQNQTTQNNFYKNKIRLSHHTQHHYSSQLPSVSVKNTQQDEPLVENLMA